MLPGVCMAGDWMLEQKQKKGKRISDNDPLAATLYNTATRGRFS